MITENPFYLLTIWDSLLWLSLCIDFAANVHHFAWGAQSEGNLKMGLLSKTACVLVPLPQVKFIGETHFLPENLFWFQCNIRLYLLLKSITGSKRVYSFFSNEQMPLYGATDVSVLDFWWLLWVTKPGLVVPYSYHRGKHNVIPWDSPLVLHLLTSWQLTV